MAKEKNSFVLYKDLIHTTKKLTNDQKAELLDTILAYVNDLDPEVKDPIVDIAFEPVRQSLKRDLKKWEAKKEKLSEVGRLGGIKSGESRQSKQMVHQEKNEPNEPVSVSVSGSVSASVNNYVISDGEVDRTVEFCKITLHRTYTTNRIRELHKAFLIQNKEEHYLKESDRIRHFRNWIKTQPDEKQKEPEPNHNLRTPTLK